MYTTHASGNIGVTCVQFCFLYDDDWRGQATSTCRGDLEVIIAFYDYSVPLDAECCAFVRL
jgi:hypothetical protein